MTRPLRDTRCSTPPASAAGRLAPSRAPGMAGVGGRSRGLTSQLHPAPSAPPTPVRPGAAKSTLARLGSVDQIAGGDIHDTVAQVE